MKSVAFISHSSVLNGAPICLAEAAQGIGVEREDFKVYFGLPVPGMLLERFNFPADRLFFYGNGFAGKEIPVTQPRIKRRLKNIYRKRGIEAVVANTLESFRAVEAAFELGLPSIWMIHELLSSYQSRREWDRIRKTANLAGRIVFNSQAARRLLPLLGEGLEEKSSVIYPGVVIPPEPGKKINELGIGPEEILLGSAGDICPGKGYEVLLRAFQIILAAFPGSRLLLLGRIPREFSSFAASLRRLVSELHLSGKIIFGGEKLDLFPWLNSLDIFIHPSRRESLGRVIIEALGLGKPVVAAFSGGAEEIITDGETGRLVPSDDPAALADAALEALRHPEEARQWGEKGKIMVSRRFPLSDTIEKLSRELQGLWKT